MPTPGKVGMNPGCDSLKSERHTQRTAHTQNTHPSLNAGATPAAATTQKEGTMAWSNTGHVQPLTRRRILNRDNHTCTACGYHDPSGVGLEIDHRDNTRNNNYNTDQNLQTLCKPCHRRKTLRETKQGHQARATRGRHPTERHPGLT